MVHVPHGHQKSSKAKLFCKFHFSHTLSPILEGTWHQPSVPWSIWMQHYRGHESLPVVLPAATVAWGQGAPESLLQVWQHEWAWQCQPSIISREMWYSWAEMWYIPEQRCCIPEQRCDIPERQKQERACPCALQESICHGLASPHISLHMLPPQIHEPE